MLASAVFPGTVTVHFQTSLPYATDVVLKIRRGNGGNLWINSIFLHM